MSYSFDSYGWLSAEEIPGRTTDIEPPAHGDKVVGQPYPNFISPDQGWAMPDYVEPAPYVPPASDYGTRVTRLAFRNRFTGAEKVALYTVAVSSIPIKIYLDDLAAATFVDLSWADTIASVGALVSAGLLTSGRATAILTDPVTPEEVPVQ